MQIFIPVRLIIAKSVNIQCLPTDERKNVHNELLFGHKKECINTCYKMDKPGKHLCQPKEANHERPHSI